MSVRCKKCTALVSPPKPGGVHACQCGNVVCHADSLGNVKTLADDEKSVEESEPREGTESLWEEGPTD